MTIRVELLNKSEDRSIKIFYRDIRVADKDAPAGITESPAGTIPPAGTDSFYIHSNRQLIVIESDEPRAE